VYVPLAVLLTTAGDQVPEIPFVDITGSTGAADTEHIAATGLKVGVTFGLTVIVNVVVVAHCPASGVKVYSVVAVLFNAGLQIPVMPLIDVVGSAAKAPPEQIGATAVKVGVRFGLTVIVNVVVVAHCPASGVNVYVVVAVLFNAGLQVPVMPLVDVVGKAASTAPEQIGVTAVNVGVMFALTVMFNVVVVAH
jgi:hypothetical protein